jgi:FAD/FMN-containing dehydrogenase
MHDRSSIADVGRAPRSRGLRRGCHHGDVERYDRRSLIRRGGRLAAGAAGLSLAGVEAASAAAVAQPSLADLRRDVAEVISVGDARYAKARLAWNARFDGIHPLAVVRPRSVAEVKAAVRWAKRHDVRLAIRSGGHSYAGLSSTTGIVLDLAHFAGVTVQPDGTARMGAGIHLRDAYTRLWAARRAIATGSHPTVGLGGLALGGGQGFASRAHGLTSDNVTAIEIVTADGARRVCTAGSSPDLFWALRGGGAGSFGVVTSLTVRTFPVARVTTFHVEWPWAAAAAAIVAWQTFMLTAPDSISSVLALRVPPTVGGDPKIAVNGQMLAPRAEAVAALAPLTGAGSPLEVTITERPFDVAVRYFEGTGATRARLAAKSAIAQDLLTPAAIDTLITAVNAKHRDPRLRGGGVVLFAYGGAVNRVDPRATAFVHRNAVCTLEYVSLWSQLSVNVEQASVGWVQDAHAAMRGYLSGQAVQNYADTSLAGWKRAYYGQNLERLVKVKKRYDPGNLFRHALSIPVQL